jgi:sulfatase modifying factor 1
MLHHTRRWNRSHREELQSAWLNGVGVLVWENVFGSWVGWSERDKAILHAMLEVQRARASMLTDGEWTPLAAHGGGSPPAVVASRWTDGATSLWAVVNRADEPFSGTLAGAGLRVEVPAQGVAALINDEQVMAAPSGESAAFPARPPARVPATAALADEPPDGFVEAAPPPPRTVAVFRRRETGTYGEAPYVEEWKPLPPRLHDFVEVPHDTVAAPHFAIARREVTNADLGREGPPTAPATGVDLDEARTYAASVGARLPTEDEWQLAAEAGLLERLEPLVWNWTESEHSDGRTPFAILKGGSAWRAEGSDWYVDGGPQEAAYSLKLLLPGAGLARSPWIGFRLAVDLE